MMDREGQKSVVKLAVGGSLAGLAIYMGSPMGLLATLGQNLAAGVGVNLVSLWADESVEALATGWFGQSEELNHDVARVLGEALAAAAGEVRGWLEGNHNHTYHKWVRTEPERAEGLLGELSGLEQDGGAAIGEWARSSERRAEIAGFMQGRAAGLQEAFRERVQELFKGKGYKDEVLLAHDLREQLTARWQAHFVARLKRDEAARVACEQLWRAALQEGLEQCVLRQAVPEPVEGQQAGAMQALQQALEALKIKAALPTIAPSAGTDEGLEKLFRQALSDWLAQDWADIVALLAKVEGQQAALLAGQEGLQATTKQIEAQGDVLLDEVEEVKAQGDVLLDEVGEANQRLQRIERLIVESQRVQQVAQKRRVFCGVGTLPGHYIPREQELAELRGLLMSEQEVALTALTGMGGMGKTVLARALAYDETCAARYPDGVLWGELGPQADDEQDADAILIEWALAAGLVDQMGDTFFRLLPASKSRILANHLQQQRLLFVVDDVWHSPPARLLTQVRGPNSGLLVTTRSAIIGQTLHLTGYTLNQLQPDEALALLAKRRNEPLSEAELPWAEELVQRLGYHPLAVELAAAQLSLPGRDWHTFLSPLRQEQGAIGLLELERARPSSLQLCFDLSYERLEPPAQKAYRWLGVMAADAPFRWQDAQALWHWTEDARPLFHTLLDTALLEEAETGYRQHLLLREDALRRLTAEEQAAALTRHGHIYRDAARQAERASDYRPIARDYAQIEAILRRSWQSWQETNQEPGQTYPRQEAFELLNSLVFNCRNGYWSLQGLYAASLRWLPRAAELAQKAGKLRDQGAHLGNLGLAYADLGEVERAISHYNRALEISRQTGDKRMQGSALGNLGLAYANLGELSRAIEHYNQALEISRQIGDKRGEGAWLGNLGIAYKDLGEVERAIEHYNRALEIHRQIGDKRGEGNDLGNLGLAYRRLGEVERAIEHYNQALEISRQIGHKQAQGSILGNLGLAYADLGELSRAIEHYNQALEISRQIGHRHGEANHLANLGQAYKQLGQMERARALWREALQIYEAVKSPRAERVRGWLEA
ncbi:MAG: tetratricopeptide repeat protein [Ardenticatenaceae bacterium]